MAKLLSKKFIGNDEIDGNKILLEQGQSIKIMDSQGQEVDLIKLGASDEVLVKGVEVSVKSSLDQEIVDRQAGDSQLASDLSDETSARISADQGLDGRLTSAESSIVSQGQSISNLESDLADETSARVSGDQNLQSQIDAITGGGSGSLSAVQSELDTTQSAVGLNMDGSLPSGTFGTNYVVSAISVLNAVQLLDIQAKTNADAISDEVSRAQAAEADLQDQINNVLSNVDGAALDSLTEIVTAFQAADASLNGAITALSTGLSADIDSEEAARIAADSALQGEIDAEEIARAAADTTLQNNINAEQSARISGDNVLQAAIDSEESDRIAADALKVNKAGDSLTGTHSWSVEYAPNETDQVSIQAGSIGITYLNGSETYLTSLIGGNLTLNESTASYTSLIQALGGQISLKYNDVASMPTEEFHVSTKKFVDQEVTAEETARIAADDALDVRVSVLESVVWFKEKFSISNGQTSVTLSHVPEVGSMSAFVDRLAIHEGASDDFTISGTTMTFLNDLVSPGQSTLGNGDTVYVKYQYKV